MVKLLGYSLQPWLREGKEAGFGGFGVTALPNLVPVSGNEEACSEWKSRSLTAQRLDKSVMAPRFQELANTRHALVAYCPDSSGSLVLHTLQVLTVTTEGVTHNVVFQDAEVFAAFGLAPSL